MTRIESSMYVRVRLNYSGFPPMAGRSSSTIGGAESLHASLLLHHTDKIIPLTGGTTCSLRSHFSCLPFPRVLRRGCHSSAASATGHTHEALSLRAPHVMRRGSGESTEASGVGVVSGAIPRLRWAGAGRTRGLKIPPRPHPPPALLSLVKKTLVRRWNAILIAGAARRPIPR